MVQEHATRRTFLKATAGAAVASSLTAATRARAAGANERISVGVIGCGDRGRKALMDGLHKHAKEENVEITAVCDPWGEMRRQAIGMVKEWWGREPRQFSKWQELLALKDVDAVMIACPDFLHSTVLKAAAEAGKDAYCEKPWAMGIEELNAAVDAVKANKRIVQAGTQLRSMPSFTGCKKLVESGALGRIVKVEQVRNNTKPYWHSYSERPIQESDVDWEAFLGPRPKRPFNGNLLTGWYGYREFSDGPIGGYMSHFIDLVHYITGEKFPASAVTIQGSKVFKDDFTCPEIVQTTLLYPSGMLVSYATTMGNGSGNLMHWIGTRGMIDSTDWDSPTLSGGSALEKGTAKDGPIENVDMPTHMQNWLQCLRTRQQPNANVDAGYQHGVACILSDRALVEGRRMAFDSAKRQILPG
jgi:predicted dehydrogenase